MENKRLSLIEIEDIAYKALIAAGASKQAAHSLALATAATEADGVASHGLAYIPIYAEHVRCGKVNGQAIPKLTKLKESFISVDAANGFAHTAIKLGFEQLIPLAKKQGIAALAIHNSYNCGVLGYHTYNLAKADLVGIGFTNAPASIAPSGGKKPVLGTNPFSIAVPPRKQGDEPAIVIDQSASVIAKSEIMKHARENRPIPLGWALDSDGNPTTDPNLALKGSMMPSGGYKGVGVALMVEILAAALAGGNLGIHASPFSGPVGGPPATGQFFIAIHPFSHQDVFAKRIADLVEAISSQQGSHLPGQGRLNMRLLAKQNGVIINSETLSKIQSIIDTSH